MTILAAMMVMLVLQTTLRVALIETDEDKRKSKYLTYVGNNTTRCIVAERHRRLSGNGDREQRNGYGCVSRCESKEESVMLLHDIGDVVGDELEAVGCGKMEEFDTLYDAVNDASIDTNKNRRFILITSFNSYSASCLCYKRNLALRLN